MKKAFKILLTNEIEEIHKLDKMIDDEKIIYDNEQEIFEMENNKISDREAIYVIPPIKVLILKKALDQIGYKYQISEYGIDEILDKMNLKQDLTNLDKRILTGEL